jgi:type 2 lantibiotic biosynthesis protein LanM
MVVDVVTRQQMLATIATRASTPLERLKWEPKRGSDLSDPYLEGRLERLASVVGAENDEVLERWLAQQGLKRETVEAMLSSPSCDEEASLPAWTEMLDEIVSGCGYVSQNGDRSLSPMEPLPFEELLLPFVVYARQRLIQSSPRGITLLAPEALISLERWLLTQLCRQAEQCFYIDFYRFRDQWIPDQHDWQELIEEDTIYQAFVQCTQGESLLPFFQNYSVLARLLVLLVEQWVEICQEFLQRLTLDRPSLAQHFGGDQELGPVMEIIPGHSDRHCRGRTVWLLIFGSGLRLVYKPHCLKVEEAFFSWLASINQAGFPLPLRVLRVLSRDGYGWVEYVEHFVCQSVQEVQRYYQRAGALLCLLYILGITDIHSENLIANGEQPVVVDVEVYDLPHRLRDSAQLVSSDGLAGEKQSDEHTVLSAGLLPGKEGQLDDDRQIELCALGMKRKMVLLSQWRHINTDAMVLSQVTSDPQGDANAVILDGVIMQVSDFSEEIISGFRDMYRFLLAQREELLTQGGSLSHFVGCPTRFIPRFTSSYMRLLERLKHPRFLCDGADRWVELCILQKPLLQESRPSVCWKISEAEMHSLEQFDVPFFFTRMDCHGVWTDEGNKITDVLVHSAQEQIDTYIAGLSEEDMEYQVGLIRSALEILVRTGV